MEKYEIVFMELNKERKQAIVDLHLQEPDIKPFDQYPAKISAIPTV